MVFVSFGLTVGLHDLKGPFQSRRFHDSMINAEVGAGKSSEVNSGVIPEKAKGQ